MKMSAIRPVAGIQVVVVNEPSLRCWRMKWWCMSMCLVLDETVSVLAMVQVLWLSQKIGKGMGEGSVVSERKSLIHNPSLMVLVNA